MRHVLTLFRWFPDSFLLPLAKLCASAEGRSLVKQKEYRSPCTRQRVVIDYYSLVTYLYDILSTEDDRVLVLLMRLTMGSDSQGHTGYRQT